MANKEGNNTFYLRASIKHPARRYQLGRHAIGALFGKFELNEAEIKELGTIGPQTWIEVGTEEQFKTDQALVKKASKKGGKKDPHDTGFGKGVKEEF